MHVIASYIIYYYYSFKIFLRLSLAKGTRIIHHNQLLMTTFGRIFRQWTDDVKSAAFLQVNAPLTEKTWGWGWVVLVVKTKMADISLVSRVRTEALPGGGSMPPVWILKRLVSVFINVCRLLSAMPSLSQFGRGGLSVVAISFYALSLLFGPCWLSEFTLAGPQN